MLASVRTALERVWGHFQTNPHGGVVKQASALPTATNFNKNANSCGVEHIFEPNSLKRAKYGSTIDLAYKMGKGDFCICPNRIKANGLINAIAKIHGKGVAKSKTLSDGISVKVWRA